MKYKHIIFDFDGVLVESNAIRLEGFQTLFQSYSKLHVDRLIDFAKDNAGISRYQKIKYFFDKILNKSISDHLILDLAAQYSSIVKNKVVKAPYVTGALGFIAENYKKYFLAIVSASDQEELRDICEIRGINQFFYEILGSPDSKEQNFIKLRKRGWIFRNSLFIGDSINDYNVALSLKIDFIGRNSGIFDWNKVDSLLHINDFSELKRMLV